MRCSENFIGSQHQRCIFEVLTLGYFQVSLWEHSFGLHAGICALVVTWVDSRFMSGAEVQIYAPLGSIVGLVICAIRGLFKWLNHDKRFHDV